MTSVVEFELRNDSGRKNRKNCKNGGSKTNPTNDVSSTTAPVLHGAGELQESLPLFAENTFSDCAAQAAGNSNPGSSVPGNSAFKLKNRSNSAGRQDHLACAKRLSRAMRQIPTNSKQHIQAGRLVCHHLVAMLHDSPSHNLHPGSRFTK